MSSRFIIVSLLSFHSFVSIDVHLVVGPILGLVTDNSVKILIETNVTTTISFHVFHIDKYADEGEYLFTEVHHPFLSAC